MSDWHIRLTPARADGAGRGPRSGVEAVVRRRGHTEDGTGHFVVNLNAYLHPGPLDLREPG